MLEVAGSDVKSFPLDHLGLIAAVCKDLKIAERIRALLQVAPVAEQPEKKTVAEVVLKAFGVNIELCPQCGRLSLRIVRSTGPGSG